MMLLGVGGRGGGGGTLVSRGSTSPQSPTLILNQATCMEGGNRTDIFCLRMLASRNLEEKKRKSSNCSCVWRKTTTIMIPRGLPCVWRGKKLYGYRCVCSQPAPRLCAWFWQQRARETITPSRSPLGPCPFITRPSFSARAASPQNEAESSPAASPEIYVWSVKNSASNSLLIWKILMQPILTASLFHLGECTFRSWEWKRYFYI